MVHGRERENKMERTFKTKRKEREKKEGERNGRGE